MLFLFLFLFQTVKSILYPPLFISLSDYFYFEKKDYHLRTVIFKSLNRLLPFNHNQQLDNNLVFSCAGFYVDQTTDHRSKYYQKDNAAFISFEIDFRGKVNCQVRNTVSPQIGTLLVIDYSINVKEFITKTQIKAENDKFHCSAKFSTEDPIITRFVFKGINQVKDQNVKEKVKTEFLSSMLRTLKGQLKDQLEQDITKMLDFQLEFPQPTMTQYLLPSTEVEFKNKRLEFDFFYSFFQKPVPYEISTGMPFTTNKNVVYLSVKGLSDNVSSIIHSFDYQFEITQDFLGLKDKLLINELEYFSDVSQFDPETPFKLKFDFAKIFSLEPKSEDSFLYVSPFLVEVKAESNDKRIIKVDGLIQLYLKMEVENDKIKFVFDSHTSNNIGKHTMEGIFEEEIAKQAFKKLLDEYLEIFISILNKKDLVYLGVPISKVIKLENPRWIGAEQGFAFQCDFELY